MIHFFPIFSAQAADTVLGRTLRDIGAPHRIFADAISLRYRTRLELLFVRLPRLARFAVRSGFLSLARSSPPPDAVVLGSDIEVLIFAAWRALLRRRVSIVHGSFIYTQRASPRVEAARHAYYRLVMSQVDLAIVHSQLERDRYRAMFPAKRTRFAFIPYGTAIESRATLIAEARALPKNEGPAVIVTAGKSGRDYATLIAAIKDLDIELRIICDLASAIPPIPEGARVTVLSQCYGPDYLRELASADCVVIPLSAGNISAGQMVLIQAKALGRALITTDTPTVRDYVTDGEDGLLVPISNPLALRAAIKKILADPSLRSRLEANASTSFDRLHSNETAIARQVSAIQDLLQS